MLVPPFTFVPPREAALPGAVAFLMALILLAAAILAAPQPPAPDILADAAQCLRKN